MPVLVVERTERIARANHSAFAQMVVNGELSVDADEFGAQLRKLIAEFFRKNAEHEKRLLARMWFAGSCAYQVG